MPTAANLFGRMFLRTVIFQEFYLYLLCIQISATCYVKIGLEIKLLFAMHQATPCFP